MSTTVASFTESATETCKCDKCGYIYAVRERATLGKFNDHTQAAMPTARPSCCVVTRWILPCLQSVCPHIIPHHTSLSQPCGPFISYTHSMSTLHLLGQVYNQSFPLPYPKSPGTQNTMNVRHLKTSLWTWPETL